MKTSTGYGTGGATIEDLELMRKCAAPHVQVKAAGGVRDLDTLLQRTRARRDARGATRTSAMLEEAQAAGWDCLLSEQESGRPKAGRILRLMIKLGFVSAILPELSLEEVIGVRFLGGLRLRRADVLAARQGGAPLCRRHALDVTGFKKDDVARVTDQMKGIAISGLGYYPNPLTPTAPKAQVYIDHIKQVIEAARRARRGRGQHVHRPRLDEDRWTTTGRASSKSGSRSSRSPRTTA